MASLARWKIESHLLFWCQDSGKENWAVIIYVSKGDNSIKVTEVSYDLEVIQGKYIGFKILHSSSELNGNVIISEYDHL